MLALPLLLKVTVCWPVEPTVTLPKLRLVALRDNCAAGATSDVAEREAVAVGVFTASLTTESVPLAFPAVPCGVNFTVKMEFAPAAMNTGIGGPVTLKPAPVTAYVPIARVPPPVLLSWTVCWAVVPMGTLPKLTTCGLMVIPGLLFVPVPVRGRASGESAPATDIVMPPVTLPAAVGANPTLNAAEAPEARTMGAEIPVMLNPCPVMAICVMITPIVLVFVMLAAWLPVDPTATLPKATMVGLSVRGFGDESLPGLFLLVVFVTPQLLRTTALAIRRTTGRSLNQECTAAPRVWPIWTRAQERLDGGLRNVTRQVCGATEKNDYWWKGQFSGR